MRRVFVEVDDVDRHGVGCVCGRCDPRGRSFGVGIYDYRTREPIERVYDMGDLPALEDARYICHRRGWLILRRPQLDIEAKEESCRSTIS